MERINLLPPEVLEKRTFEQRIKYVALAAFVLLAVLGGVYGLLVYDLSSRTAELQEFQQREADLRTQAEAFAIFEQNESELAARVGIAQIALANRVAWGRLANELSLVLPADVWVVSLNADEVAGVTLALRAPDSARDVPDQGHKAAARTLVRLVDLEQLTDVWLASSAKELYQEQPAIDFSISAMVEGSPGADPSVAPGSGP